MRFSFAALVAVAMAVAIGACSSSPSASSTPGVTLAPGTTATPAGVTPAPTGATQAPGGGTGTECAPYPTMSLSSPGLPSFAPDPALEAKFPTQIDGQPVSELESGFWAAFLCMGGQAAYDRAAGDLPGGFNWAAMSFGSATYSVDDEDVKIMAFRTPGQDANGIVQALTQLAASLGGDEPGGTLSTGTVGGKNVYVLTDPDGSVGYGYVSGDVLFTIESGGTESQATKILSALP